MKYLKYFEEKPYPVRNIDVILDSYLETALWTEEDMLGEENNFSIYDFSEEDRNESRKQIKWFVDTAKSSLNGLSDTAIGHDIWLSRNGHGSGFWDRDIPKHDSDFLMELCHQLGTVNIYVGDNGNLYMDSYSDKYLKFDVKKYREELKLKKAAKKYNL